MKAERESEREYREKEKDLQKCVNGGLSSFFCVFEKDNIVKILFNILCLHVYNSCFCGMLMNYKESSDSFDNYPFIFLNM